jgi:hypothetical protein
LKQWCIFTINAACFSINKDYFMKYPDGLEGDPARGWGFRTEIGTAVVPTFESLKKFMPKQHWWPIDKMWDLHYFGSSAFNATPDRYKQTIAKKFGEPVGVEDFCKKAQLINIEANKAMYEGWLDRMCITERVNRCRLDWLCHKGISTS